MPSASARKSNLRAAFVLKNPELIRHVTHFALVDDVVTTMATVEALSGLLLEQKTCRVDVWCLARASH
jgi:predicted amidophosphoribosyltransferase